MNVHDTNDRKQKKSTLVPYSDIFMLLFVHMYACTHMHVMSENCFELFVPMCALEDRGKGVRGV